MKRVLPQISFEYLWTLAGCKAVEFFMGGPRIPFAFGRVDDTEATAKVPPNGLLPDASQGATHLREIFGRMGFSDDIGAQPQGPPALIPRACRNHHKNC